MNKKNINMNKSKTVPNSWTISLFNYQPIYKNMCRYIYIYTNTEYVTDKINISKQLKNKYHSCILYDFEIYNIIMLSYGIMHG